MGSDVFSVDEVTGTDRGEYPVVSISTHDIFLIISTHDATPLFYCTVCLIPTISPFLSSHNGQTVSNRYKSPGTMRKPSAPGNTPRLEVDFPLRQNGNQRQEGEDSTLILTCSHFKPGMILQRLLQRKRISIASIRGEIRCL